MAYGKSKEYMRPNSFAQQGRRSMQRPQRGGGGGAPYFVNQFKPTKHGVDKIRLLPGQYLTPVVDLEAQDYVLDSNNVQIKEAFPYWKFIEHYHGGKKKSSVCSAGPLGEFKNKGERCVACEWFWYEWRVRRATGDKNKPKSMSRRNMWSFSVLVMNTFHKVPDKDDDGKVRVNPNTQQAYYKWLQCAGRGCEYCAAGYETKNGHVQHWPMGQDHFNTMLDYSIMLGQHCSVCGTQEAIQEVAWVCGHEDCGDAVIDMSTTTLSQEQIDQMTTDAVTCPQCRRRTYLKDVFSCRVCSEAGRQGQRASLFDVDFKLKRVEDPSGQSNATSLSIIQVSSPKPIDSIYGEDLRKALDLPKIYAPTTIERQVSLFDLPPQDQPDLRQPVT